jgi:hypothetical protein
MKNIATALVKAQKEFGPALKTATNPHFRSKYANLSNCVEAVIDALNNNGIFLLQKNYDHQNGIMVETVFVHESGEMLECGCLFFPAQKNDPQGFMSALTYGRRASLMAACGIAPEDDDGNMASRRQPVEGSAMRIDSSIMADHLIAIQDAKDSDELKAAYTAAYKACGTDANWQKKIIAAKDEKKASLA